MIEEGQLYAKNGKDFLVHEVRDGFVYGVLYYSKDRGELDAEIHDYEFRKVSIADFAKEKPELVEKV